MTDQTTVPTVARRPSPLALVRMLVAKVIEEPVQHGRLRDVGWPRGLRAIVGVGVAAYVLGVLMVMFSGALRRDASLVVPETLGTSLPRDWVWLLLALVLIAGALLQTAALHAVWWLRWLAFVVSLSLVGGWGLRFATSTVGGTTSGLLETALTVLLLIALLVFVIVRGRRGFVWWEFPVVLALLAIPIFLALERNARSSRPLGYDFAPLFLQGTVTALAPLALPAAVVAGLAVAEIAVSTTVGATRLAERYASRRFAYGLLGTLVVVRLGQAVWELAHWDFVSQSWHVFLTWALLAAVLGGLSLLVLRVDPGRAPVVVSELPERLARMSFPLAAALVGFGLVATLAGVSFVVATALNPQRFAATPSSWFEILSSPTGANIFRALMGLGLVLLAMRSARRGQAQTGLLLCAVAVMLWARVVRQASSGFLDTGFGAGALNLIATAGLVGLIGWYLVRRTLTARRALALSGALVLSALVASHDFISDPAGALLGVSGVGLVLFGVTWGLLTDNEYANHGSRWFPIPTRVMLALANVVLIIAILAYTSLARDPGVAVNLDLFATLGDEVLGTGLMAAAFVGVLAAVKADRPVE
ncbi:MAG: hypothetical protein ABWX96_18915 [Propionibacteriaceae bacterium]